MSREIEPAEVFHPWEYIEDAMNEHGWDRDELARRMGGDYAVTRLSLDIFSVKDPGVILGEDSARQLAVAFGTGYEVWLNLWAAWSKRNPAALRAVGVDAGEGKNHA